MKKIIAAGIFGLSLATSSLAYAEPVKIGVITTLSGGGAGLGIDMRDAFALAIKQSGNKDIELVVEDSKARPTFRQAIFGLLHQVLLLLANGRQFRRQFILACWRIL